MSKKLISVIGPTAIGKTSLAIALANHFDTEIISADSRQFFKEMRIGTAVPSTEELKQARHHFIQHKSIFELFTVGDFERAAIEKIEGIFKEKDYIIMVGGSGLYVDAVINGLDEFPKVDPEVRIHLNTSFEEKGIEYLQQELQQLDLNYYKEVDINNPHRLMRALEICIGTGRPYSSFLKKKKAQRTFQTTTIGMMAPRETIYERINQRVALMMEEGLLEEARSLYDHKALNALQTVGYKELFHFFDGHGTLEFAVEEIKKNTRRFAKRQLTWYRKKEDVLWVDYDLEPAKIIDRLEKQIIENNK
ncbi:MAG: tRNA (adenosine(37)-N6)-dimethylallyltransferase MiaA [Maribacter sp.]